MSPAASVLVLTVQVDDPALEDDKSAATHIPEFVPVPASEDGEVPQLASVVAYIRCLSLFPHSLDAIYVFRDKFKDHVALIVAAHRPVNLQGRSAASVGIQCTDNCKGDQAGAAPSGRPARGCREARRPQHQLRLPGRHQAPVLQIVQVSLATRLCLRLKMISC